MKYRRKPVIVDAIQWTGKNSDDVDEFTKYEAKYADNLVAYFPPSEQYRSTILYIPIQGKLKEVSIGDYIIKDNDGKFSNCDSDIFKKTYEAV